MDLRIVNLRSELPGFEEKIRLRAYELYEQRGMVDGHALGDWLQAEAEVLGAQKDGSKSKRIQRRGKS